MLENYKIDHILFLDVETVPQVYDFKDVPERAKYLFNEKVKNQVNEEVTVEQLYRQRGGILAEFGKIICISVGYIQKIDDEYKLRLKSFYGDNEKKILEDFSTLLNKSFKNEKEDVLCAHNGKEFDFPYLCRRMLVNGIKIPKILQIMGKKPWEINHIDTLEFWKFGDYKHYTSLELLTEIFGIPSPKDDIKGSDVARVYWEENNLNRIAKYCQKDVLALVQLFLRFKGESMLKEDDMIFVDGE
jgi:DNA polymerase elongation subunit (family B)